MIKNTPFKEWMKTKKNYADNNSTTPWQRSTAKVDNVLPK